MKFDPITDLVDLKGKVAIVTGGKLVSIVYFSTFSDMWQ